MIRVDRYRSIHAVDEVLWDSLNAPIDLFHTHRFVRSVEEGETGNAGFWYLLFFQNEILIGTAILSSLTVSLDLFLGKGIQYLVGLVRRLHASFFSVKILFCGLPISIGKHAIAIRPGIDHRIVLDELVDEMSRIALENNIGFLCVKEFLQDESRSMDHFCCRGFFRAASLPYPRIQIRWEEFLDYIQDMRYGYRRAMLRSMRKLGDGLPSIRSGGWGDVVGDKPALIVGREDVCSPGAFHTLYLDVMRRAPAKLETLSLRFFENLFKNLDGELEVLSLVRNRKILGAALFTVRDKRMTFLLVGLDYAERDRYDVYFNLMYGLIATAIGRGYSSLDLGQTSYWLKSRVGADSIPVYFYLRANGRAVHNLLRLFNPVLFPSLKVPQLRVFKQ